MEERAGRQARRVFQEALKGNDMSLTQKEIDYIVESVMKAQLASLRKRVMLSIAVTIISVACALAVFGFPP